MMGMGIEMNTPLPTPPLCVCIDLLCKNLLLVLIPTLRCLCTLIHLTLTCDVLHMLPDSILHRENNNNLKEAHRPLTLTWAILLYYRL